MLEQQQQQQQQQLWRSNKSYQPDDSGLRAAGSPPLSQRDTEECCPENKERWEGLNDGHLHCGPSAEHI